MKKSKNSEVEVAGDSNSELKEEPEDKDKQTHEVQFFNYEELTPEEATRIFNILKPSSPAKDAENQNRKETASEFKGTEAETNDEDEDDTEEKLGDPGVKEPVKVCMEAVVAGNLPLVASSPTTVIMRHEAAVRKVIAGGHDATKGDMEAEDDGDDIEILGKGGG